MTEHHELCGSNWGNRCNCPVENEQLTSNLRVFPMRFGMADSSYTVEYMLASEVRAEIERLTAELQGTKDELYSVDKVAKELGAERDRLRAALERARAATFGQKDELLKLHDVGWICEEALAGAAVETKPAQTNPDWRTCVVGIPDCGGPNWLPVGMWRCTECEKVVLKETD